MPTPFKFLTLVLNLRAHNRAASVFAIWGVANTAPALDEQVWLDGGQGEQRVRLSNSVFKSHKSAADSSYVFLVRPPRSRGFLVVRPGAHLYGIQ